MFKSTLDIDTTDKETVKRLFLKIYLCPYCRDVKVKPSDKKGYHFTVSCLIDCPICRLCYDDTIRFAFDCVRPEWARNILFDKKEGLKIG